MKKITAHQISEIFTMKTPKSSKKTCQERFQFIFGDSLEFFHDDKPLTEADIVTNWIFKFDAFRGDSRTLSPEKKASVINEVIADIRKKLFPSISKFSPVDQRRIYPQVKALISKAESYVKRTDRKDDEAWVKEKQEEFVRLFKFSVSEDKELSEDDKVEMKVFDVKIKYLPREMWVC